MVFFYLRASWLKASKRKELHSHLQDEVGPTLVVERLLFFENAIKLIYHQITNLIDICGSSIAVAKGCF